MKERLLDKLLRMKTVNWGPLPMAIVITLLLVSAMVVGQAPTKAPTAENVEQSLSKMEQDWVDASLKKDTAFVDGLLADDYIGIGSDGSAWTKSKQIEVLRSGELKFESVAIDGVKIRVFGDTAVVTYRQTEKSRYQGKDTSGRTMFTDIFVNRNGKWQIIANHASRVEETKK